MDLPRIPRDRLCVGWTVVPPDRRAAYLAATHRAGGRDYRALPMSIRQPLSTLIIPTRRSGPEVPLDLRAAFGRSYADGRFRSIDYARPPDPPPSADDAAWAVGLLAGRA